MHVFTHGFENSSGLCFPCVDSYSEGCPWDITIVAPSNMIAVSCGELTDVVRDFGGGWGRLRPQGCHGAMLNAKYCL